MLQEAVVTCLWGKVQGVGGTDKDPTPAARCCHQSYYLGELSKGGGSGLHTSTMKFAFSCFAAGNVQLLILKGSTAIICVVSLK